MMLMAAYVRNWHSCARGWLWFADRLDGFLDIRGRRPGKPQGAVTVRPYMEGHACLCINAAKRDARSSATCAVVLAEARAGHNVADGPVVCAQAVGRAAVVSRSG